MPRLATLLLLPLLCAGPALAQTPYTPPAADPSDGGSWLDRGLESLMGNLFERAQPSLDRLGQDLGGLAQQLGPVLGELGDLMDDVRNYQAPERLENGDILIRRRADAPPPPPIGPNLQDMMRPRPETPAPEAAPVIPRDPAAEVEL